MKPIMMKIITFFLKKKIQTATGEMEEISKTKIFMTAEGILRAIEFASPYFGSAVIFPPDLHGLLYTLAGLSYAERELKK